MKVLAVIPARYASTRFPGKPLAELGGESIISRVYNRVRRTEGVDDVMVAADDRVQPVLAYSLEDSFQAEGMSANIRFFLKEYVDEIAQIVSDPTMAESLVPQWREALTADARGVRNVAVVGPLLTTRWNQNAYYNNMCPADTGGPNGHTFVGCVATAMGQIMRYWQYPTSGIGSHSYSSDHSGQG